MQSGCSNMLPTLPQVFSGSRLIAHQLTVNSQMGDAVMLNDRASAFMTSCTLSTRSHFTGDLCLGLVAKSDSTLAMYESMVQDAQWGVYAGLDAGVIRQHNTFQDIDRDDVTQMYNREFSGQKVQPWRPSWVHPPSQP